MGLKSFNNPEPHPIDVGADVAVYDLVFQDLKDRDAAGSLKYGTRLKVENGRDPLIDLYQELMDSLVYCRQELYKRYGQ